MNTSMSATEEDTELRDLLVQTLEGSGVLNKIKAELRAAVFLALEEQEKVENKAPLVNESLKKFLNTKDGRLVCSLITEFLQFFHLDFTLAVFQPETNMLNGPQNRQNLARDLGIGDVDGTKGSPLLMELLKLCRQKDRECSVEDVSSKQITEAKKKFEFYDKNKSGEISKDELRALFMDLFPHFHQNMIERYVNDELKVADKDFNDGSYRIDFQEFMGMYKRLFLHYPSVDAQDIADIASAPPRFTDGKASSTQSKLTEINSKSSQKLSESNSNHSSVAEIKQESNLNNNFNEAIEKSGFGLDEVDNEGDSFFDDPIPEPDKCYSWRKESSKTTGGFTDLTNAPILKGGQNSRSGVTLLKETDKRNQNLSPRDLKTVTGKFASLEFGNGEEEDYMDDFNSTSHRSDKSEFSIGEEIEEDFSAEDFNASDHGDDLTQDHSLSHASTRADYLEDVA